MYKPVEMLPLSSGFVTTPPSPATMMMRSSSFMGPRRESRKKSRRSSSILSNMQRRTDYLRLYIAMREVRARFVLPPHKAFFSAVAGAENQQMIDAVTSKSKGRDRSRKERRLHCEPTNNAIVVSFVR